jgi:predicted  nucleic acid-binding Zn-ribbon protein
MLVRCSRCGCMKDVPSDWLFKECVDCHTRTVERYAKERSVRPVVRPEPERQEDEFDFKQCIPKEANTMGEHGLAYCARCGLPLNERGHCDACEGVC